MRAKRFTAVLLTVFLFLSCPLTSGAEEEGYLVIWSRETAITPDLCSVETVFTNGSRQSEHYITYRPGGEARPELVYGDGIREKLVYTDAAERSENRVLAGINGDYFVMATGMPLGLVVHEGELISSDAGNASFGFMEDGSAILGLPGLSMLLSGEDLQCTVSSVNKNYKAGEFCLYSDAWGEYAPLSDGYRCVELLPEDGQKLQIGGELTFTVSSVSSMEAPAMLEEGKMLLCYSGAEAAWQAAGLERMEPGMTLTLRITAADERFTECTEALGCLYPLMAEGEVLSGLEDIDNNKAPRTAIGIREDGSILLYTADGRQSGYAIGLTLQEVAGRLQELGCVEAGALDGGASTVLASRLPGEEECSVKNSPSLGRLRETPQFLLITARVSEPGPLETIGVFCEERVLLAGSSCDFFCGGCDAFGAPVNPVGLQWSCDRGSIGPEGTYRAPDDAGEVTITARSGSVNGVLRIPVVRHPDEIKLLSEDSGEEVRQLRVLPGSVTDLSAEAMWNGMKVCAADELFDWSLEGEIGTVSADGTFEAVDNAAVGYLTVSCGEASCRVQVLVTDRIVCIEDYEVAENGSAPGLQWSPESNRDQVRYGVGSLRLDYDLSQGSVTLPMEQYPTELGSHACFWVLSDGSGNNLYSVHEEIALLLGKLDHAGWMLFTVDTEIFGRIQALRIGGSGSGTLWLDQLLIYSDPEPDTEAPVMEMDVSGHRLTAQVWDQAESVLGEDGLRLTVDGEEWAFDYDGSSGILSADLPETGHNTRVILIAQDRSGNYNSASILLETDAGPSFPDMEGHWASPYVDHLHSIGVIAGRLADDGTTYYDPDSRLTRAEFAVMLCRWLGFDTGAYASAVRFADEASIPFWAEESVKAAAALGLIHGAAEADGLYFMPQQYLTRAQAAVILGRNMPGGRMMADLPWADAGEIPSWSRTYVAELAFMGVMTGKGENFEPNAPLTRAEAAKMLSEMT